MSIKDLYQRKAVQEQLLVRNKNLLNLIEPVITDRKIKTIMFDMDKTKTGTDCMLELYAEGIEGQQINIEGSGIVSVFYQAMQLLLDKSKILVAADERSYKQILEQLRDAVQKEIDLLNQSI